MSYEKLVDKYYSSRMDHVTTMRSIELMGRSVIPVMARLWRLPRLAPWPRRAGVRCADTTAAHVPAD